MFVKAENGGTDHDGASCLTLSTGNTIDFGSQQSNSWNMIATIPEPTSGVLLLVGVAALALRRKKAA